MSKYYLIKFSSNWADEMDIEGFSIMTEEAKDKYFKDLKEKFADGPYEYSIGTNEEIEFEEFKHMKSCYTITEIEEMSALAMISLFDIRDGGVEGYGFFPRIDWD